MIQTMMKCLLTSMILVCIAMGAGADTLHLKDGRVLEGKITREGELFVFFEVVVGGIADEQLHMRDTITRIERDTPDVSQRDSVETPAVEPREKPEQAISASATKITYISLEGTVGPSMNAQALRESINRVEDEEPDIVVLVIDSGGGALAEVQPLSDVIEKTLKPKYRVVVWVNSAISAAAMTAVTCEEIYFMSKGNLGAATAFSGQGNAVKGEDLEFYLRMMEQISIRGDHDPLIMRAMQIRMNISCDINSDGMIKWREDLDGRYIVSTDDRILTFNALDAMKYKFGRGIADTKEELATMLGADEWVEVGYEADAYQQDFRKNVKRGEVESAKVLSLFQSTLERGQVGQAKRYLGQLRSWSRRAPSLVKYGSTARGVPPLTREFFRTLEEELNKVRSSQANRRR